MNIAIIGFGAIGRAVLHHIQAVPGIIVSAVCVRTMPDPQEFNQVAGRAKLLTRLEDIPDDVRLVVECAGHGAVQAYAQPILRSGRDLVVTSVGALADSALRAKLDGASRDGGGRLLYIPGAMGGLDSLRAAKYGGLQTVKYTGRKPVRSWPDQALDRSVPVMGSADLRLIFEGTAQDAALRFPQNANVTAAIALAGIGFEKTQVKLLADGSLDKNVHSIEASGAFGRLAFEIFNHAMPNNPNTSMMTAFSILNEVDRWHSLTSTDAFGVQIGA